MDVAVLSKLAYLQMFLYIFHFLLPPILRHTIAEFNSFFYTAVWKEYGALYDIFSRLLSVKYVLVLLSSSSLQEMVKLGVDLSRWDKKKGVANFILRLDFDADMKQYIR